MRLFVHCPLPYGICIGAMPRFRLHVPSWPPVFGSALKSPRIRCPNPLGRTRHARKRTHQERRPPILSAQPSSTSPYLGAAILAARIFAVSAVVPEAVRNASPSGLVSMLPPLPCLGIGAPSEEGITPFAPNMDNSCATCC